MRITYVYLPDSEIKRSVLRQYDIYWLILFKVARMSSSRLWLKTHSANPVFSFLQLDWQHRPMLCLSNVIPRCSQSSIHGCCCCCCCVRTHLVYASAFVSLTSGRCFLNTIASVSQEATSQHTEQIGNPKTWIQRRWIVLIIFEQERRNWKIAFDPCVDGMIEVC